MDQKINFDVYKKHIKYQVLEEEEKNITIQYISYNYGVVEGNISIDEALQLIEERSGFTQYGTLIYNLE